MNSFTPERKEDESFEDYKIRRKQVQQVVRSLRKGRMPTVFVQHQPNQIKQWSEAEQIVRDTP